jgi:ubiquinone/menaquinone biosynthesis C-methylase UbiE
MLSRLDRLAYRSQHFGLLLNATLAQEAVRIVTRTKRPELKPEELKLLFKRRNELHARDLANVDAGLYPRSLLFDIPLRQYAKALPALMRDTPRVVARMRKGDYKDIPAVDKERFPAYYRRTFHWQTDGYFTEESAEKYDLGVQLLFRGTADVMRRQIIPPITRFLREHTGRTRLLDVACGTGNALRQLAAAHPDVQYYGVDLSPAYIRTARKRLAHVPELALSVENGEHLPFADASFDIATSVYLFHELPRNARRNVIAELHRVVRPGGLVVLEDSAQLSESRAIESALRAFPGEFHEPFYADYLEDDLEGLLQSAGFTVEVVESHLVAKVVVARR